MLLKIFVKVLKVRLLCFVPLNSDQLQRAELSSVFCNDCGNLFHNSWFWQYYVSRFWQYYVINFARQSAQSDA